MEETAAAARKADDRAALKLFLYFVLTRRKASSFSCFSSFRIAAVDGPLLEGARLVFPGVAMVEALAFE